MFQTFLSVIIGLVICILTFLLIGLILFPYLQKTIYKINKECEELVDEKIINYENNKLSNRFIKRICDIFVVMILSASLVTTMILSFIFIRMIARSTMFVKKDYMGYRQKKITVYRFNTKNLINENKVSVKFGEILEKTSLDQMPVVFSILKGDMSFIGLTLIGYYTCILSNNNENYNHSKPGLASLFYVNTKDYSIDRIKACNNYYIKNYRLSLDFKIILSIIVVSLFPEKI